MDASKDKKEAPKAPKGIIQSKNATFVHQLTSSFIILWFFTVLFYICQELFSQREKMVTSICYCPFNVFW